jgi:hypothetical protein
MQDALPRLQQLTHLHLSLMFSRDCVLEQLRQLSALRELRLSSADCTTASFAADALPKSLTNFEFEGVVGTFTRTFSPSTTPALTQLTALQELRVACIATFDAALLDSLTALRLVHVFNCSLGPTAGLTALSSLTQLQHLQLPDPSRGASAAGATAEIAALTTSSHLTLLGIGEDLVEQQHIHLFPEGKVVTVGPWAGGHFSTLTCTCGGRNMQKLPQSYHADALCTSEVCNCTTTLSFSPLFLHLSPAHIQDASCQTCKCFRDP